MPKLLVDENFKRQIVVGLRRRAPRLDVLSVQEVGLAGAPDPELLAYAASLERILLTHDARTMPLFAYRRLEAGEPMPGVVIVPDRLAVGQAIDELLLLLGVGTEDDFALRVLYLPL